MTSTITAKTIADRTAALVGGEREREHGPKLENHQKIAEVWNGILVASGKRPPTALDAHDVANLMEGLKIARRYCGAFNIDDYVDGAGYAACAGEIRSALVEQARIDATWSAAAIEGCPAGAVPIEEPSPNPPTLHYLATPYSKYPHGITHAYLDACRLAARLIQAGMVSYSPIAHTHPIAIHGHIDPLDHSVWLPFDEVMMSRCDELLVAQMDGWDDSDGIAYEIGFFTLAHKPVRFLNPDDLAIRDFPWPRRVRSAPSRAHDKAASQYGGE